MTVINFSVHNEGNEQKDYVFRHGKSFLISLNECSFFSLSFIFGEQLSKKRSKNVTLEKNPLFFLCVFLFHRVRNYC